MTIILLMWSCWVAIMLLIVIVEAIYEKNHPNHGGPQP
jgi:hypothetical protein